MKIGYARVSTEEQSPQLQIDALLEAGCELILDEVVSGAKSERPKLAKVNQLLRKGDTLVVWKLDRFGRSLKDLISWINDLNERGIHFESLQENIETSTPTGKLIFHVFGAIAEFERDLIRERTKAGLASARARGRKGGRKPKLNEKQKQTLRKLHASGEHSVSELLAMFSISRRLLYNVVAER